MNELVEFFVCDRCGNATRKLVAENGETLCTGCFNDEEKPDDGSEDYDAPPLLYDASP